MFERLEVYDLKDKLIKVQERSEFYADAEKEFKKTGKVTKKLKRINLLLMNSQGRIYLQKRSNLLKANSGLYDKTVGGHVYAGATFDLTFVKECAEELGFPASILKGKEFDDAVKNIDLGIVGVFKHLSTFTMNSERVLNKDKIIVPYITAFYLGYYNGPIKFSDGESSGIEVFSVKELEAEIKKNPTKFTEDLKVLFKKYKKQLLAIK